MSVCMPLNARTTMMCSGLAVKVRSFVRVQWRIQHCVQWTREFGQLLRRKEVAGRAISRLIVQLLIQSCECMCVGEMFNNKLRVILNLNTRKLVIFCFRSDEKIGNG